MAFVNEDFSTKIIVREVDDNENKNNFTGIASTSTNSEDYGYTQSSNEMTSTLGMKQRVAASGISLLRNLLEIEEKAEMMECTEQLTECKEDAEIDIDTVETNYESISDCVNFKSPSAEIDGQEEVESGDNVARHLVNGNNAFEWNWNRYSRKYVDNNPYVCDFCDETFACSKILLAHYSTHTDENRFKCNVCYKHCSKNITPLSHDRARTNEKPYVCNVCDKSFKQKSSLNVHYRLHTGERPYVCNVCGKSFTQKGSLNVHYRSHTGERPFKCGLCEKSFQTNSKLTYHKKKVHNSHL